jgi:acetone carboxylase gamma subunit
MKTATFTGAHHYAVGDILLCDGKLIKIIEKSSSNTFTATELNWLERMKIEVREIGKCFARIFNKVDKFIKSF